MLHLSQAVGKCQNQVPYSCAIGPYRRCDTADWDLWPHPNLPGASKKEAIPVPEARSSTGSPTVRRRELGTLLRALRNERGLTVDQVATRLLCSSSKVSRMETGQRGATLRDIRDLCEIYRLTDASQVDYLMGLVREAKQQ